MGNGNFSSLSCGFEPNLIQNMRMDCKEQRLQQDVSKITVYAYCVTQLWIKQDLKDCFMLQLFVICVGSAIM